MRVKICGLRSRAEVRAAVTAGASYGGLVFFPRSPRHLPLGDARWIVQAMPDGFTRVALTVNASNENLDRIVETIPLDMLQLHGAETPERVAEIRARYGLPVMKAIGVAEEQDLAVLPDYARVADQILIDARAPKDAALPGGNGVSFDWRLLSGRRWSVPWMLAGGLTPSNVAEAILTTGASQVDVSSGVEIAPGYKDPRLIAAFTAAALAAGGGGPRGSALDGSGVAV
ncbi:phosphoribosylanthranilate isomerase [Amaricoccus solimangrovi]|uniref:N-(5'-phosphoribosyl)anthranilate isomerase n=1 Tax=Amaricoccus solimangrovi TaxID=2589815 RepID=A0A501WTD8_9RHOB|nr:phosphoribosylanthranilate isomerase [Amaricoccus solimangrovi]TPE50221.1 phosphoribosylanthranilate isomerase [Amaricoccus solimangrovi]